MYKYIGIDLDGTLLNSKKEISSINTSSLLAISSHVSIIIVSGRHFSDVLSIMRTYNLSQCISHYICSDGAYIFCDDNSMVWSAPLLKWKDVIHIKSITHLSELEAYTYNKDFLITSSVRRFVRNNIHKIRRHNGIINLLSFVWLPLTFEKAAVNNVHIGNVELEKLKLNYNVHNVFQSRYEFLNKNCNKWIAIQQMCEKGLISLGEFLYFGDDYNDEECFRRLPACVVMGNAPKELRKYSIYNAKTNDEDGVSDALKNLL